MRVEKLVHHQPFQKRLSPPLPGNCGAFVHLFSPGGGALANLARPRGRALGKPGENHGVCLMFGNFKSRTIAGIIKNVVENICKTRQIPGDYPGAGWAQLELTGG